MQTLGQDLRFGARQLLKSPGFTAVALLTLALGIGANSAIFSFVNAILLKPLPYPDAERLVFLTEWSEQVPNMSFSVANFQDVRDQNKVFESVVASRGQNYVLTGHGDAEQLRGRQASSGLFRTLGLQPLLGRPFSEAEDKPGAERVALLSEGFWTRRFGRDPDVVGRTLTLNNEPYTVIGVMPGTMHGTFRNVEVWTSLLRLEDQIGGPQRRGSHPGIYVLARMKPGVSPEQARTDVVGIAKRLAETYPSNARQSMTVEPALEAVVGDLRAALVILLGAVGFVLLIACANVANLLLSRAAARQKEIAVRQALGAGRWRIVRQLLTESLLLAAGGGLLGLLVAWGGIRGLIAISPENTPRIDEVSLDLSVLAFTFAVSLVTGLVFGLLPALQTARHDHAETLKDGGRGGSGGPERSRARAALVVAEVALSLVLLVGAGLMSKSFLQLLDADPGFDPKGVLTMTVGLPQAKYPEEAQRAAFFEQVLARLQGTPGVQMLATTAPLLGGWQTSFGVEGRPEALPGQAPSTDITRVSPGYFRTMGVTLLKGRDFTEHDRADQPPVIVVDETMASTWWPNEDPIGKRLRFGAGHDTDEPWRTVIGVVRHVKNYGVDEDSRVETYVPYLQEPIGFASFLLKAENGDPAALSGAVRAALKAVDPDVPLFQVRGLEEIVSDGLAEKRLSAQLLGAFAALALLLSAIGIYGVMSYAVTQQTLEIGIRVALGAQRPDILRMVMRQGMRLATLGVGIGLVLALGLALGLGRLLGEILFRVSPTDPPTFAAVPVILTLVALAACWIPARRALGVDPISALRWE
ncbi:MAG: ABC transporter permease [Vicinamibacteria bacterium]|nr:ABC transporter permease [Vicinamibacteria bacterium]